jgi:hypothetical protein
MWVVCDRREGVSSRSLPLCSGTSGVVRASFGAPTSPTSNRLERRGRRPRARHDSVTGEAYQNVLPGDTCLAVLRGAQHVLSKHYYQQQVADKHGTWFHAHRQITSVGSIWSARTSRQSWASSLADFSTGRILLTGAPPEHRRCACSQPLGLCVERHRSFPQGVRSGAAWRVALCRGWSAGRRSWRTAARCRGG